MASLYASVTPQFTRELLSPGLRVGYTDPGGVWQFLAPSLSQRLPLRAIEWRNLVGVTKRIDQLPLHFVEASPSGPQELPLANIYLVKCEDLDSYKTVVRGPLASWVDAMASAKVEWLVLYVPLGTRPKGAGNQPNPVYRKVFERLRTDFTHKKGVGLGTSSMHERVCKIDTLEGASVLGQQQQHESQWTELLLRLRHCVMDAFQIKCFQYEEQLRVLDAKRNTPGWDFGAFFLAKEKLALMYQQMYLQDDAIRHLDELDAIFVNLNEAEKQTFRDESKNSFTSLDPIFSTSPLAVNLHETQQFIAWNRASARLISLYCFCRQIRTLYVMGNFQQLLQRASAFIEAFLSELQGMAAEGSLDWHQPFLWAVGACLEVTYACELSWSGRDDEWTASSVSVQVAQAIPVEEMSRALGDVLYLARRLLKGFTRASKSRSGLRVSFGGVENEAARSLDVSIWYQQLERVFVAPEWQRDEVCEPYERCISEISHLASMHFSQSGRHRFAVFLGGECARFHLAHGEFESASRLLRSLARQSEEDGWWNIFGDCVRCICRAELALGRSTQAVAACFSMLQLAQEEQVGVSKDEMEQLMHALVGSLERKNKKNASEDTADTKPMVNMGELFKPTMTVETSQTSDCVREHGDIRVTVGISNDFPASVHLERVRVCFVKAATLNTPKSAETSSSQGNACQKDSSNLDDLVLDENETSPSVGSGAHSDLRLLSFPEKSSSRVAALLDNIDPPTKDRCEECGRVPDILLEESNVYLDEKTGVNLVFLHSGVPVGQYVCTGIECVLAGNTFHLLPPGALALASFDIAAKESTVQVAIHGAPLLMPRPFADTETLEVSIAANEDTVLNGTLEVRASKRSRTKDWGSVLPQDVDSNGEDGDDKNGEEEQCAIQFIAAMVHGSDPKLADEITGETHEGTGNTLSVSLPTLNSGMTVTYVVSMAVLPNSEQGDDNDHEDATDVTIAANVKYQRGGPNHTSNVVAATTELRRTESSFRIVPPLAEGVRLKRVGARIFTSIALTCNPFVPVVLQDYKLVCPEHEEAALVVLEQDPNTKVRDTALRPRDCIHLAFTLACTAAFENEANDSYCSLRLMLNYGSDATRQKTMTVPISLADVEGKRYRIDVVPKVEGGDSVANACEVTASEPVVFQVIVQEGVSRNSKAALHSDTEALALCLTKASGSDWILVGKEIERFDFSSDSESEDERHRRFTTQKNSCQSAQDNYAFPRFSFKPTAKPFQRRVCFANRAADE